MKADALPSNRLAVLAADIRQAHLDTLSSFRYSAQRAVDAGTLLLEAKELVPAGRFLRWVAAETALPYRTAAQYMKLSRFVSDGCATVAHVAEVGQNAALKVADQKQPFDPGPWTPDQETRRIAAENGACVVANMHEGADEALLAWARETDRFVRIDRQSEWGNPFEMPDDGDRAMVVGKFTKFYLPHKDGLLGKIPSLRGKVLGCWCHPEECHGHIIAEIVNREDAGDGEAEQIADELAEVDG